MRVLRREALNTLYPLPDGLHFTPAMSARALMTDQRVVEIPMSYAERVGESKLRVLRDGVRFLSRFGTPFSCFSRAGFSAWQRHCAWSRDSFGARFP